MTAPRLPQSNTTAYRAAAHLHKTGPLSRADLFAQVHLGPRPSVRDDAIDRAVANGWLTESPTQVACGIVLAAYFGGIEPPTVKAPTGQVAMPRQHLTPLYAQPSLSKRHIPNSRGNRDDVPEFSVRSAPSFRSVPTGGHQ